MTWEKIKRAVRVVAENTAQRIDGDGWKVYAVGSNVIRIDLAVLAEGFEAILND